MQNVVTASSGDGDEDGDEGVPESSSKKVKTASAGMAAGFAVKEDEDEGVYADTEEGDGGVDYSYA